MIYYNDNRNVTEIKINKKRKLHKQEDSPMA